MGSRFPSAPAGAARSRKDRPPPGPSVCVSCNGLCAAIVCSPHERVKRDVALFAAALSRVAAGWHAYPPSVTLIARAVSITCRAASGQRLFGNRVDGAEMPIDATTVPA
jgi:hypothetical protein